MAAKGRGAVYVGFPRPFLVELPARRALARKSPELVTTQGFDYVLWRSFNPPEQKPTYLLAHWYCAVFHPR